MTQSFDRYPYLKTPNCEQQKCACGERKVGECDEEWGLEVLQSLSHTVRFARAVLAIKPQSKHINKD